MLIRKAKIDDAAEIQQLVLSLSHFYLADNTPSLPKWFKNSLSLSEFRGRLSSTEFTNFVFEDHNKIYGYISIKNESHIFHLFVSETCHNEGIATMLWKHARSTTNQSKYTVRSSKFAIPVYKRFGFKETESKMVKDGLTFQPMELVCSKENH